MDAHELMPKRVYKYVPYQPTTILNQYFHSDINTHTNENDSILSEIQSIHHPQPYLERNLIPHQTVVTTTFIPMEIVQASPNEISSSKNISDSNNSTEINFIKKPEIINQAKCCHFEFTVDTTNEDIENLCAIVSCGSGSFKLEHRGAYIEQSGHCNLKPTIYRKDSNINKVDLNIIVLRRNDNSTVSYHCLDPIPFYGNTNKIPNPKIKKVQIGDTLDTKPLLFPSPEGMIKALVHVDHCKFGKSHLMDLYFVNHNNVVVEVIEQSMLVKNDNYSFFFHIPLVHIANNIKLYICYTNRTLKLENSHFPLLNSEFNY